MHDGGRDRDMARLAAAQGLFNAANGLWPLVHERSFEAVFGPKADRWLMRTVAGLLIGNGWAQLKGARGGIEGRRHARRLGVATAATLLAIDLRYAVPGRISRMYLVDAAVEAAWIVLWLRRSRRGVRG